MKKPRSKVSIITISFNSAKYIEGTIRCVLAQTYPNIEYIIIDGGSTDGTVDIIKKYADRIAYWVSEPDKGISDAFNKGVSVATGEIVNFLNSQDYYFNDRTIEKAVKAFEEYPGAKIVYGKTYYVPEDSTEIVGVMGSGFLLEKMESWNIIPHQSTFEKKEVYEQFGPFSENFKFVMDYEYFLRATRVYAPVFIDEGWSVMRLGGISDAKKFAVSREIYRAQKINGVSSVKACWRLLVHYAVSLGLGCMRLMNIYTVYHLKKKIGFGSRQSK